MLIFRDPQITKVIRDDKLWMGNHEVVVSVGTVLICAPIISQCVMRIVN